VPEKIQIVVTAQDRASAQLKGLKSNIAQLGNRTGGPLGSMIGGLGGVGVAAAGMGVAAGLAGVAIGKVSEMLIKGVGDAIAEEASLKRLDAALEANIDNWDGNRDAIDKAIDARMDLGFQDDVLRDSMIKLVTATQDQSEALDLQGLAMDVARGRNIDLGAATDIVLKANMGNVGALRRMGIEIDKTATKEEALLLLQERYAGQTEAFMETTTGKVTVAATKFEELQESIGGMLLPFIADTATAASGAADQIERMADALGGAQFAALPHAMERGSFAEAGEEAGRALTGALAGQIAKGGRDVTAEARALGRDITDDLAGAVRGSKDNVKSAMEQLTFAMTHPLKMAREVARIEGALTGNKLAEGLQSTNPWIRTVAQQTQDALLGQLREIKGDAYVEAFITGRRVGEGIEDGYTAPRLPGPYIGPPRGPGVDLVRDGWGSGGPGGRNPSFRRGRRAAGGPVTAGETYLVGERGPEMVTFGRSGHVTPNHAMGGQPIVVNVDGRELFRIMDQRMGKRLAMSSSGAYVRG
jgi:hypothetical protein